MKPPKVVTARNLHNANAVPMSKKNPRNWLVALSYGQNSFLLVASLTDLTGPQPTKQPPAPKRPYLRSQGHVEPLTGFTGSAFSIRSNLFGGRYAPSGPQDRGNPLEKLGVEAPDDVTVRKLRNATAFRLRQKFPENSPVAPSYG